MEKLILLIDANALIHRAFHAYPTTLTDKNGQHTNAVYGFSALLFDIFTRFKPDFVVCAFDSPKPTFRHEKYKEYKATRKPIASELIPQFAMVKVVLDSFNIPIIEVGGLEADDILGSLAASGKYKEYNRMVVSGDQDLLQLVDDKKKISVYLSGFNFSGGKIYDEASVVEKLGITAAQVTDFKALLGDQSDNIPGVRGIGKKGAIELITRFGGIDEIYGSLDSAGASDVWLTSPFKKYKEKLLAGRESAVLSKYLATIISDAGLDFDVDQARADNFHADKIRAVFSDYQFKSLLPRINKLVSAFSLQELENATKNNSKEDKSSGIKADPSLNSGSKVDASAKEVINKKTKSEINVTSDPGVEVFAKHFDASHKSQLKLAVKFVASVNPKHQYKVYGLSLGLETNSADSREESANRRFYYFSNKYLKANLQKIQEIFNHASSGVLLVGFDLKLEKHLGKSIGLDIPLDNPKNLFDVQLAAYVLAAGERSALNQLKLELQETDKLALEREVEIPKIDAQIDLLDTEVSLDVVLDDSAVELAGQQVDELLSAYKRDLDTLYYEIELPVLPVIYNMESEGISVDASELKRQEVELKIKLEDLRKYIYEEAGEEFNINSPKQVGDILFGKLNIQDSVAFPIKKTKSGGFSTDERTLGNFSGVGVVAAILEFRELAKLISTYTVGLREHITSEGKIHTTYNQAVAATGRLSSTNPNLQNIPISSELGNRLRRSFTAGNGRKLISFDYSQQELRLLAHLSKEDALIETFRKGEDIHSVTAAKVLGKSIAEVNKEDRRIGKTVNFGVVYGISAFGLADRLKIEQKQAAEFIKSFFTNFPKIQKYFTSIKETAVNEGAVYTILGRRRGTETYKQANPRLKAGLERELLNFPLQGSAADVMKLAMIKVQDYLDMPEVAKLDIRMHLQVHDELVLSVPENMNSKDLEKVATEIKDIMYNAVKLDVPLTVSIEIGMNWYEMQELILKT